MAATSESSSCFSFPGHNHTVSFFILLLKIKHKLSKKQQSFRHTQCPNLLIHFHLLLQVDYISGIMQGIVNKYIGGNIGCSSILHLHPSPKYKIHVLFLIFQFWWFDLMNTRNITQQIDFKTYVALENLIHSKWTSLITFEVWFVLMNRFVLTKQLLHYRVQKSDSFQRTNAL